MLGKTVIVTGGNTGIGYETAKALYQANAEVTIAARDMKKAASAMERILGEGISKGRLSIAMLNLSSLKDVASFASEFNGNNSRLDVLINNAGVMVPPASKTEDGFELQFGVNFLGHFALTAQLFQLLKSTPHARIVTLSSGAATLAEGIDFDNLRLEKSYEPWREYAISKLCGILLTYTLDQKIKTAGLDIISVASHPGVTRTDLQRHIPGEELEGMYSAFDVVMEPWQGALPTLYAATVETVKGGEFYGPDGEKEFSGFPAISGHNSATMRDVVLGEKLWNYAQVVTQAVFDFEK